MGPGFRQRGNSSEVMLWRQSGAGSAGSEKRALGVQGLLWHRGGTSQIHRKPQLGARVEDLGIGFSLVRSLLGLLQLRCKEFGIQRPRLYKIS